ncbi:MAG: hypothetical protein KBS77_03730 [Bacteroidales bacterium]|nr:hypothetical protein [Candidatus Colicola faecequi]
MKKLHIILSIAAIAVMAACTPEPISEESAFLTEEAISNLIAADGGKLYTLDELLDKYMTEKGNYLSDTSLYRTRANNGDATWLFAIDTLPSTGNGIYVRGRVTTDDYGGNFYKSLCIQQIVGGKQQAIRISVDASSVSGVYPLGQEILIRCNGLAIGRYADQPQLCVPSYNNNNYANNAEQKIGWAPGRIPWAQFQEATHRIGKPDMSALVYDEMTIADFQNVNNEDAMRKLDAHLVVLKDVWFTGEYENNGSFSKLSTGDPEDDTNANVFAPTTENIGYPQSRVITDGRNKTLVSNSEYCKFAAFYIPGADANGVENCPKYKGTVMGILGQYRDNARYAHDQYDWSISIRDIETSTHKGVCNDVQMVNIETGEKWEPREYGVSYK